MAQLKILWPSGREVVLENLPMNLVIEMVEGEALAESFEVTRTK